MNERHDCGAFGRQRGAALVVGLVLLVVVTLLAVSGLGTATLEVRMAGNTQYRQNAFEIAEAGIEQTLAAGGFNTTQAVQINGDISQLDAGGQPQLIGSYTAVTSCTGVSDPPPPPPSMDHIYSLGSTISASHFSVVSTGTAQRGASAEHTQGFYVIGPAGGPGC